MELGLYAIQQAMRARGAQVTDVVIIVVASICYFLHCLTPPYSYSWNSGQTTQDVNNINAARVFNYNEVLNVCYGDSISIDGSFFACILKKPLSGAFYY
ncbi:hypothetical protein N9Y89_00430 [bacterium]|nr:hypothetical protein [bacterium]